MPRKAAKRQRGKKFALWLALAIVGTFMLLLGSSVYLHLSSKAQACANSESCISDLSSKEEANNKGIFMGREVTAPVLAQKPAQNVLGETTGDHKRIYVDLTKQRLYAYEGNNKIYDFPVSTGKWGQTPTGNFRIWIWLRYTRMSGGSGATYYNLPNVPYTMYFYNSAIPKYRGFGIHGAYWHNNFGHPMSHGCVNMRPEDAGKIFYWTNTAGTNTAYPAKENPGTPITIYGVAPNE